MPQLRDLHDQIAQLGEVLGSRGKELGDIKKSIEQAIQSQNEQVAVQAVAQTKKKIEAIKNTVSDVDETGKRAVAIIDTAIIITGKLLRLVNFWGPEST